MKLCFIDVETSGLNSRTCAITQLAGTLIIDNVPTTTEITFNYLINPRAGKVIEPAALEVQGRTLEELRADGLDDNLVYGEFIGKLDKHINKFDKKDKAFFIAYNARFDEDFIRQWFTDHGNKYFGAYFWFPPIDVMQMAMFCLMYERDKMADFKLGTVAERVLGKTPTDLHDGLVDINLTRQIFNKLSTKFCES